jgi:hypothetical protein
MDVGTLFIADPQPAELVEPRKRPLHNPPPFPSPLPCQVLRCASSGCMPFARNPARIFSAS